ncbi:hypothetical protein V7O66_10660 [Methanolobus sp. ZRKC3]|uniref:hypothetical protein n=1 Tax=Methanolobus sp. ZRKC3 TaxID=3125786 RepID=UPI0032541738
MEFNSPIFDIKVTGKNKERLQALKNDFDALSNEEKFDVLEFQNIMMTSLSKYNELSGIKKENEMDVNEVISRMSSRSLDHSQMSMAYLRSQVVGKREK